jgi:anti-sigma regulatory factor (Ser/Thr protein kinase)
VEGPNSVRAPEHDHAAMLYKTPKDFAGNVRRYLLADGNIEAAVLVVARPAILEAVSRELDGVTADLTMADLAIAGSDPGRMLAAVRQFAVHHPRRPVRCIQDWAWRSRSAGELCEAVRHEALIDLALASTPVSVLCGYDGSLDVTILADAERTHPLVMRNGRRRVSRTYRDDGAARWDDGPPLASPPAAAAVLHYRDNQAAVRAFTAQRGLLGGLSPDRVTDLVIAVGELAANTLAHTNGYGSVTIWPKDGEVICAVEDTGHISDPLVGTLLPDPASRRKGRGLWVVHQLCDLVEVRTSSAGTVTHLHMALADGQPGDKAFSAGA